MTNTKAEDWLSHEDFVARENRIVRLKWMANQLPQCEHIAFQGGLMSKYLYEETRYCFAYGQYLATVVLGLAFIEHSLAGQFYTGMGDDLERASVSRLFNEALDRGWITQLEFENLDHARKIRNPVTHFHGFNNSDTIEMRSLKDHNYPYAVLEADAYHVMETIFHLMGKNLLCWTA